MVRRVRRPREQPIDWALVRERLARAQAATAAALEMPPDRARAIMDARARALARAPAKSETAGDALTVMTFALGPERYGIETIFVRAVVRLVDFTPVPGAPDVVLGVTNLRGDILCIVDLRRLFNVAPQGLTDLSRIIVVGTDMAEFGVLADETYEINRCRTGDVLPPPDSVVSAIGRDHLLGVTRDALILLDGGALLRDPRLCIDQSAAPPQQQ